MRAAGVAESRRSLEGIREIELRAEPRVIDGGPALILGRKALALARVVRGAMIAGRRRVERHVVGAAGARGFVPARPVRYPGVEHDDVAGLGENRNGLESSQDVGAHRAV